MHATLLQRLQRTLLFLLRLFLCLLLFFLFFGLLSIRIPTLLTPSRTAAVTATTFAVVGLALLRVCGGFSFGHRSSRATVAALSTAILLTDAVTLLQLHFMQLTRSAAASSPDPSLFWLVPAVFLLQLAALATLVRLGNALFFRLNPPKRCILVYGEEHDPDPVYRKLCRSPHRFTVTAALPCGADVLWERLMDCDAVILWEVPPGRQAALLSFAYGQGLCVYLISQLCDVMVAGARPAMLDDLPLLCVERGGPSPEQQLAKRCFDLLLSGLSLLLLGPLMLAEAAAVKLCDGGPVFFRQERATKDGRVFQVLKFRTMVVDADSRPAAQGEDDRITRVGRLLRRFRLDELPQLLNIFRGEMSLVGPRPEHLAHVERYTKELPAFRYRLRVKAGLTGLAQIAGRYNTAPKTKLMLDLMYIQNYSVHTDLAILLQTAAVLFQPDSTEGFPSDAP